MSSVKRPAESAAVFGEHRIAVAAENFESQEQLFAAIRRALTRSGRTSAEVSKELGLSGAELIDWISGDIDLALSELRQLANAVDAKIIYTVSPARAAWLQSLGSFESNASLWIDDDSEWGSLDGVSTIAPEAVAAYVN
ncbi:hypothetical protein EDF60_1704 [Leucobacter luti]|uniref:helix-turn-helix domain-containing protein n=1 Tax=Leucobacter luti TaxID=340320 RepID=UPI00104634A1|nr:helix-turn-helix transcriptional regulator [Leucobacter luti]MCW2287053.1 transcriptional regulator with XRE-family HTH domain [Leucobacter luti]TCK41278.1 hypothetical protein EDF60_1704 [Leucobacter luti]